MSAAVKIDIAAIADRAKNILMKPDAEWDKIDGEKPLLPELFTNYVAVLAAIPAICLFAGLIRFGVGFAITELVLTYIMSLVMVGVGGFVADYLAPQFGGKSDRLSAFKLMAYSGTPAWLAGVVLLIPALSAISFLGMVFSIYLIYLGAPKLMKIPQDKLPVFTAVTVIGTGIAGAIIGAIMKHY